MTRCESYPPCFGTIYFPTAPFSYFDKKGQKNSRIRARLMLQCRRLKKRVQKGAKTKWTTQKNL